MASVVSVTQPPLRVAIDATPLLGPRTGIGAVVDQMFNHLSADASLDITGVVVSLRGRGGLANLLPDTVAAKPFSLPARGCHRLWQVVDFPKINGFDLVHGTNFVVPPAGGGAELVTIHDFTAWRFPDIVSKHSRAYPALVKRALRRGAHVHCVSEFVAAEAAEYLAIAPDRIHTVVNGFDPEPFSFTDTHSQTNDCPYVLAIGTEEPRKGYPTLVDAMEVVWANNGDVRLTIVGPRGWGSEALDQAVERSSRPNLIERRGYVGNQQRNQLLANAAVLAYPSLYEGFGIPLLEAMAAAVPVVSTKAGAIPEVVGDAASLVPANDADGLGLELSNVLDDGRLRARLVAAGLERCRQYPWLTTATEMINTYHRVLDSGR